MPLIYTADSTLCRLELPEDFVWGVGLSAYQSEGRSDPGDRGKCIWDHFSENGKIKDHSNALRACRFCDLFKEDVNRIKWLGLKNFKTSLSWSRIIPEGKGKINWRGLNFYDRLTDELLLQGIEPWYVLYHWDLPASLQVKGGWSNRDTVFYFLEYLEVCARRLGDRVSNWMVMNEPFVFTGAGYFMGIHAPGKRGLRNFLPAVHHVNLASSMGIKHLKALGMPNVGTALSFASIHPYSKSGKDQVSRDKVHKLVNQLFLDPMLGNWYPKELSFLNRIDNLAGMYDEQLIQATPDFLGVQVYTREVVKYAPLVPYIGARVISPDRRGVATSSIGQEIYEPALSEVLDWLIAKLETQNIKLYVTECGISCDERSNPTNDEYRINYYGNVLESIKSHIENGQVKGFFFWSLMDNFEWAEGYSAPFGLYHVDFGSYQRAPKRSAQWVRNLVTGLKVEET